MNAGQEPVFSDDIDIVGISCDTVKYTVGMQIAKAAKAAGKYVVMGGTHPTFDDEATLRSGYVDVVVRSEGEYQMLEIVQQFEANGKVDPSTIKGFHGSTATNLCAIHRCHLSRTWTVYPFLTGNCLIFPATGSKHARG